MEYLLPVIAYFIGSISSAVLISRLFAMPDPRTVGSGNPGATNILRQGNKAAAAATLLADIAKGVIPVLLAWIFTQDPWILASVAAAAFTGHLFPVFFGFAGGKGVATALGVYLALNPWIGFALILTWLITAVAFRYSSLAAILTAAASPIYVSYFLPGRPFLLLALFIAALLIWRHRANIKRLVGGKEDRIKLRKTVDSAKNKS